MPFGGIERFKELFFVITKGDLKMIVKKLLFKVPKF
jgi:hypothetical protein